MVLNEDQRCGNQVKWEEFSNFCKFVLISLQTCKTTQ